MMFILRLFVGLYEKLAYGRGTHPKRLLFLKSNLLGIVFIELYLIVLNDRLFGNLFFLGSKIDGVRMLVLFERTI